MAHKETVLCTIPERINQLARGEEPGQLESLVHGEQETLVAILAELTRRAEIYVAQHGYTGWTKQALGDIAGLVLCQEIIPKWHKYDATRGCACRWMEVMLRTAIIHQWEEQQGHHKELDAAYKGCHKARKTLVGAGSPSAEESANEGVLAGTHYHTDLLALKGPGSWERLYLSPPDNDNGLTVLLKKVERDQGLPAEAHKAVGDLRSNMARARAAQASNLSILASVQDGEPWDVLVSIVDPGASESQRIGEILADLHAAVRKLPVADQVRIDAILQNWQVTRDLDTLITNVVALPRDTQRQLARRMIGYKRGDGNER
jgi:hypothetical protein